jgi:hypothetical protein
VPSFRVDRIGTALAPPQPHGVAFADSNLPGLKTAEHRCVLGPEIAARFEDTEGHIVCLHEDLDRGA